MRWGAMIVAAGIVAACGGQVQGQGQGQGPIEKSCSESCSEGDQCTGMLTDCQGNTSSQTCMCSNGRFVCPHWDCGPSVQPMETCVAKTHCSTEGAGCMEVGGRECAGYRGVCTCRSGLWDCIEPVCVGDGGADAKTD